MTNPNEVTEPSNTAFLIVSEWLQQNGTAARSVQLYEMCRFVDFVQSRSVTSDAADARRYRWLKPQMLGADFDWNQSGECVLVFQWPRSVPVGVDCDRSIDAAISAGGGQT